MTDGRVDIGNSEGMFGRSEKGLRERDEDFVACAHFRGVRIGVLCDGMGGSSSGDLASEVAAKTFIEGVSKAREAAPKRWKKSDSRFAVYREIIRKCHNSVSSIEPSGDSGTTLTAVVISEVGLRRSSVTDVIHIGDSRCYRISQGGGAADLLTSDHSVTGSMVRAGYIETHHIPETAGSNTLTMHIGDEGGSVAEVQSITTGSSSFLLCCDGVWDPLHVKEGFWLPPQSSGGQDMVDKLVQEALERGSTDNCSALLVEPVGK